MSYDALSPSTFESMAQDEQKSSRALYSLHPATSHIVLAIVATMEEFSWRQISVITQEERPYLEVQNTQLCAILNDMQILLCPITSAI